MIGWPKGKPHGSPSMETRLKISRAMRGILEITDEDLTACYKGCIKLIGVRVLPPCRAPGICRNVARCEALHGSVAIE